MGMGSHDGTGIDPGVGFETYVAGAGKTTRPRAAAQLRQSCGTAAAQGRRGYLFVGKPRSTRLPAGSGQRVVITLGFV